MKFTIFIFILFISTLSASAESISVTCYPESGGYKETLHLEIINMKKAQIYIKKDSKSRYFDSCGNGEVKGKLVDYGEASLLIKCRKGNALLIQNYDELSLDIENLSLGLSDTVYLCD